VKKRSITELLGFNDRWLLILGIPLVAVIVPLVFFSKSNSEFVGQNLTGYISSLCFTAIYWFGNRQILLEVRKRFFEHKSDVRRITVQSALVLVYTLSIGFLSILLMNYIPNHDTEGESSFFAGLFISFFILSIYEAVWASSRLKQTSLEAEQLKRANIQGQLDLLKTQVNPHFLFNNLNTLASLIPEDPERAVNFVQNLSVVYRTILEVREKELVTLEEEGQWLASYIYLLEARFGESLTVELDVPEALWQRFVVPLALQILLENAIKHNVVASKRPLLVRIYATDQPEPTLIVSNNLQRKMQIEPSTQTGLANIAKRYALLCDREPKITETETDFTVALPLLNIPRYEDRHH